MYYKNGRQAVVGDHVIGKTASRAGVTAGTLLSVTPGQYACEASVGFIETAGFNDVKRSGGFASAHIHGSQDAGFSGPIMVSGFAYDYATCGDLLHADDAIPVGNR